MGQVEEVEACSLALFRQELSVSTKGLHKQIPGVGTQYNYFLFYQVHHRVLLRVLHNAQAQDEETPLYT